jgi:catechol 2,3-dioxygenase-like lactoylglutathione lyase family enzyme
MTDTSTDLAMIEAERERIRDSYLRPTGQRPASTARGLHHVAISVEPAHWEAIVRRLEEASVEHVIHSDVSVYFRDPDGARIELIADPLGEMYGIQVL